MNVSYIQFQAEMARASWEGLKTQTRRLPRKNGKRTRWEGFYEAWQAGQREVLLYVRETWGSLEADDPRCRGGRKPKPGDKLVYQSKPADAAQWRAGAPSRGGFVWRPAIHMPRWASRMTLRVTDVRLQRLQDISAEDVEAEGACVLHDWDCSAGLPLTASYHADQRCNCGETTSQEVFGRLWDSLHGAGAWDANPPVVAITFETIKSNVDDVLTEAA